jgi:hypothetical protein
MRERHRKLPTRFGPETRFNLTPGPAAPFRGAREAELERLKDRLLKTLLQDAEDADLLVLLRRAANEAAALAWTTPFPLLVLPELLEEKADAARRQLAHQKQVLQRCLGPLGQAA